MRKNRGNIIALFLVMSMLFGSIPVEGMAAEIAEAAPTEIAVSEDAVAEENVSENADSGRVVSEDIIHNLVNADGAELSSVEDITSEALVGNLRQYTSPDAGIPLYTGYTGTTASLPTVGNVNVMVVTVDFQDEKFTDDYINNVENLFFGAEDKQSPNYPYESLSAYYERASYGKLHLSGDIINYHSDKNRDTYNDNMDLLFQEVIDSYVASICAKCDGTEAEKQAYLNEQLSKYDSNGDKTLDGFYLNFAGPIGEWATQWWSQVGYYNGFQIGEYTFGSTCTLDSVLYKDARTVIHETGHMLGLADYYDHNQISNPIGVMDIMKDNILDHNGFSKMLLGWINPEDVVILTGTDFDRCSLEPLCQSGKLVLIVPDYNKETGLYTEFFMIQYFKSDENNADEYMKDYSGLQIYHIYAYTNSSGYFVADNTAVDKNTYPLIRLIDKDGNKLHGSRILEGNKSYYEAIFEAGYNCFYKEGDKLTPETLPAVYMYKQAADFSNWIQGTKINIVVDNIKEDGNGISFDAGFSDQYEENPLDYTFTNNYTHYSDTLNCTLAFNKEIRAAGESWVNTGLGLKSEAAKIYDEAGNLVDDIILLMDTNEPATCCVTLKLLSASLTNGKYKIVIPQGTLSDVYGNAIEELEVSYDNASENAEKMLSENVIHSLSKVNGSNYWNSTISQDGTGCILLDDSEGSEASWSFYRIDGFDITTQKSIAIDSSFRYCLDVKENGTGGYTALFRSSGSGDYGIYSIDSAGNIVCQKILKDYGQNIGAGIKNGKAAFCDGKTIALYNPEDGTEEPGITLGENDIHSFGSQSCKNIWDVDENHYVINDGGECVLFGSDNKVKIESDKDTLRYKGITSKDGFFYVVAQQFDNQAADKYEFYVLVYNSSYQLIHRYLLNYDASDISFYNDMAILYYASDKMDGAGGLELNCFDDLGFHERFYSCFDMRNSVIAGDKMYYLGEKEDKVINLVEADLSKLAGEHMFEEFKVNPPEGFEADAGNNIYVEKGTKLSDFIKGLDAEKYTVTTGAYLGKGESGLQTAYGDEIQEGLLAYVSINDQNYSECFTFHIKGGGTKPGEIISENKVDINLVSASAMQSSYTYSGRAIEPDLVLTYQGKTLLPLIDYKISYSNNVDVGTGLIKLEGMGSYSGEKTIEFQIAKCNLGNGAFSGFVSNQIYKKNIREYKPLPTIKYDSRTLTEGVDYRISYENNTGITSQENPSRILVEGINNYEGQQTLTFLIVKTGSFISDAKITLNTTGYIYDGNAKEPGVTVRYKGEILGTGDYTVSYSNNVNAGKATITIVGTGKYLGTKKAGFTIAKKKLTESAEEYDIPAILDQPYSGQNRPELEILDKTTGKYLSDEDMTCSYSNNFRVGSASVMVQGKGNYKGKITRKFNISKLDFQSYDYSIADIPYTGTKQKPDITATNKATGESFDLKVGKAVKATYYDNKELGTATVIFTPKNAKFFDMGGTQKSRTVQYHIIKANLADAQIKNIKPQKYRSGKQVKPKLIVYMNGVKLKEGKQYKVTYSDNTDRGSGKAVIEAIDTEHFEGSQAAEFLIK